MSKIKLEAPFRSFRGKICKHTDIIFKDMYGTKFTSQICNPYTGEPTEKQIAVRQKFRETYEAMAQLTEDQKEAYREAFKRQKKCKTLRGFIFSQLYNQPNA